MNGLEYIQRKQTMWAKTKKSIKMKKFLFITLAALFLTGINPVSVFSQEDETVQAETAELSKKEQKKLKKQQKKEEKSQLKEEEQEKVLTEPQKNENVNMDIINGNEQVEKAVPYSEKKPVNSEISSSERNQNEPKSSEYSIQSNPKQEKETKQESKPSRPLSAKEKTIIWAIVVGIIFLWITQYRYKRKCDSCKKWNAMRKTSKECVDEKPTGITEERKMKNSKGEVIRTWEESVPATVYYYRTHRKCKHCGYRDYLTSSETAKN